MDGEWWARTLLVVQRPGAVFAAMRRDDEAEERQEPVLAIVLLAGIAGVLTTNAAARVLDDFEIDAVALVVWAFIAGGIYGVIAYYALGALLLVGERAAGSPGSYVRARHLLAYACVPLALSLVLVPVKAAVFGADAFRSGGADEGAGGTAFEVVELLVYAWCAALLVIALRTVNAWGWPRALLAAVPALVLPLSALARAHGLF